MSEKEFDTFDLKLKGIMDNAEEEVPAHIWDAVSGRLDAMAAPAKRRIIPLWLRYAGTGLAVAAAIVFGVFLFIGQEEQVSEEYVAETIEVVEETEGEGQDASPENVMVESIEEQIRKADAQGVLTQVVETTEVVEETEGEGQDDARQGQDEVKSEGIETRGNATEGTDEIKENIMVESIEEQIRKDDDNFIEGEEIKERRKLRTSLTLSGNATGNTGSHSQPELSLDRPLKRPALLELPTISEVGESVYAIPLSFGIGAKFVFTPHWSLGVGFNYTLLSRTFEGMYKKENDTPFPEFISYSKIRNIQSYIGIPVNAYFSIVNSDKVDFYVYAGGTVEKCIGNTYQMHDPDYRHSEKVKGFQFSANAGIGVEFIVADMLGIYLDPSVRYYFKNPSQPKSIRTQQPLGIGFEAGFRVRL